MTNLFTPLARSVAIASLTGAALMVGSFGPASAQTPPTNKPPAAAAATRSKPETVEQRITALKTALKITPDQESKWDAVATGDARERRRHGEAGGQDKRANAGQHDGGRRPQDLPGVHPGASGWPEEPDLVLQVALRFDAGRPEEERRPGVRQLRPDEVRPQGSRLRRPIMTSESASLAASLVLAHAALAGVAAPASARWWGDGRWHEDNRWHNNNHYYGYHYRAPPVVYAHAVQLRLLRPAGGLRQQRRASRSTSGRKAYEERRAAMPTVSLRCSRSIPAAIVRETMDRRTSLIGASALAGSVVAPPSSPRTGIRPGPSSS